VYEYSMPRKVAFLLGVEGRRCWCMAGGGCVLEACRRREGWLGACVCGLVSLGQKNRAFWRKMLQDGCCLMMMMMPVKLVLP